MESIYEIIQNNPEYLVWTIAVTNFGWAMFTYFNRKSHESALVQQKHELDLDLERRKHIFELRLGQYEKYLSYLDSFGKSYQSDLVSKMHPLMASYLSEMLAASTDDEKGVAITRFSSNVISIMNQASAEYQVLRSEFQSLKFTASDALVLMIDELESLMKHSMDSAQQFTSSLPALILENDQAKITQWNQTINSQGESIQEKSAEIYEQMRNELNAI